MQINNSGQKGFSLIEALVAFLILSVGMLGIASLQVIALKAGNTASLRTVAVIKVEEMMERIRNNPFQAMTYGAATTPVGLNHGCNADLDPIVYCDAKQMAEDDIYFWKAELSAVMPPGTTGVIGTLAPIVGTQPTVEVTITVNWKERDLDVDELIDQNYSVTTFICNTTAC